MLATAVAQRIATASALKYVGGAAGFAALRDDGGKVRIPAKTPAAFVIPLRESPYPDARATGLSILQKVQYSIAIITVVRVANDRDGERTNEISDQVRQAIKDKLFGWTPEGFDEAFTRGPSALFDFEGGAHWHQDEYIIERHEEPV